ncbi:MAG: hypothetical protein R3Y23_02675 [Bacillota bacterium]
MSTKSKVVKTRKKHNIAVIIIAALLVVMIGGIVVIENLPSTATAGVMSAEDILSVDIQYTPEVKAAFSKQFTAYINTIFEDFDLGTDSSGLFSSNYGLANIVLTSLSEARISTDKVVALGNYLESKDASDFIVNVLMAYLDIDNLEEQLENGTMTDEEVQEYLEERMNMSADVNIFAIIMAEIDLPIVLAEIVEQTVLTTEELGRVAYYVLVNSTTGSAQTELTALGSDAFSAIFVDTYTMYEMFSLIQSGDTITRPEARMIRELLYEMGTSYNDILTDFGSERIEALLGTSDPVLLDDSESYYAQMNYIVENLEGLPTYVLALAGEFLTNLDSAMFDSIADYSSSRDETEFTYVMIMALIGGYEAHEYALVETGLTQDELIAKLAAVLAGLECVDGLGEAEVVPDGELEAYTEQYTAILNELFSDLQKLYEMCADIEELEDVIAKEEEYLQEIQYLINQISTEMDVAVEGANKLSLIFAYSTIMSLFSEEI